MTSKRQSTRKRVDRHVSGSLTSEDAELWNFVASSVTPLDLKGKDKKRIREKPVDGTGAANDRKLDERHAYGKAIAARPKLNNASPQSQQPMHEFDRREARRLSRGQLEIEARLDLHGLRQSEAHRRLVSFLRRAYEAGCKHVLVITGKGRSGDDDQVSTMRDTVDRSPRGILRRNVPLWLEEASVRDIVLSYREAAIHHGGSGAIYIRLRAAARSGR